LKHICIQRDHEDDDDGWKDWSKQYTLYHDKPNLLSLEYNIPIIRHVQMFAIF